MLKLENIKKDYQTGDFVVHALRGVSLEFRRNEFVSILGPSGCGKTTMLNIVGGLDRYTSGDLMIKGRSTKDFKDRDWDTYRNHSVGFVFQGYNLIPHQTVLGNVELALTIAGMSKAERTAKAKAALDKVGLSDQYRKRPNQMSGGQMQRVAIARALVNDPEIVLADEPTGALDSVTSRQIMDLLREIAKERLVIMVTHNGEIANEYSSRIVRLTDGLVTEDTNPFDGIVKKTKKQTENEIVAQQESERKRRAKMSFFTAFRLSLQNLISKRRRSIMVSIAGSIGIIGVALVLSFSFGIQGYITNMQRDMLSGYPITISQTTFDINAMMGGTSRGEQRELIMKDGFANISSTVAAIQRRASAMDDIMRENTITPEYLMFLEDMPDNYLAALHYDFGLNIANNFYAEYRDHDNEDLKNERMISLSAMRSIFGDLLGETDLREHAGMISSVASSFQQLPNGADDYILTQYDLIHGDMPTGKNEIVIVLNSNRRIADLLLAQLGYYSQQEFLNIVYTVTDEPTKVDKSIQSRTHEDGFDKILFEDLASRKFVWHENNDIFIPNATPGQQAGWTTIQGATGQDQPAPFMFDYNADMTGLNGQGEILEIVGILTPKPDMSFGMLSSGFFYTTDLARHIIEKNHDSHITNYVRDWEDGKPSAWENVNTTGSPLPLPPGLPVFTEQPPAMVLFSYEYSYWWRNNPTENFVERPGNVSNAMIYGEQDGFMGGMMAMFMGGISSQGLGGAMADDGTTMLPVHIEIYPANLRIKPEVLSYLDRWNEEDKDIYLSDGTLLIKWVLGENEEGEPITRENIIYSDTLSLVFNMIGTLVDLVTIALVAFTSLALVVSCVMIGIITYVSVVERVKEIGVIRSLGGRKRDVANLFTAETFILGFAAGVIGVAFTYLLSWSVSAIIYHFEGIRNIAFLPFWVALIMIGLSVGLTLLSGMLPSRSAARKDPVVALRTE